jgi:hypothetical protein
VPCQFNGLDSQTVFLLSVTSSGPIVLSDATLHVISQYILSNDEATFNQAGNIDYLQLNKCLLLQILCNRVLK